MLRQVQLGSCVCDLNQFIRFDNENVDDAMGIRMPNCPFSSPSTCINKSSVKRQQTPITHTFYFRSHLSTNKKSIKSTNAIDFISIFACIVIGAASNPLDTIDGRAKQ